MSIQKTDEKLVGFFRTTYLPCARIALFVIYFWFGVIKLFSLSPAGPLAEALVNKTVGHSLFHPLFIVLGLIECLIGLLFLIPKATRVVIPLLLFHMLVVCAPLILLPNLTWQHFLVPTLEGQYIIKNLVIIALAIGVAASVQPLGYKDSKRRRNS